MKVVGLSTPFFSFISLKNRPCDILKCTICTHTYTPSFLSITSQGHSQALCLLCLPTNNKDDDEDDDDEILSVVEMR